MSDACHGLPQRGGKKQEDLTRTGTIFLRTDKTNTKHRYMNMTPDPATEQRKCRKALATVVNGTKSDEATGVRHRTVRWRHYINGT